VLETPDQPVLHELEFRLSYADCDPAGIVYFAAYYPWFERTYNEWAFLGGFAPGKMVELWGATHVSVSSECDYLVPGRLHDPLVCRMRLARVGRTSFSMHFSVDNRETAETFAAGRMAFVFVTGDLRTNGRPQPTPVPRQLREILTRAGCTL